MGSIQSTVNVNLSVDVTPTNAPPPGGLSLSADGVVGNFQVGTASGKSAFLPNIGSTAAPDFSGIAAGQLLMIFSNNPVQIQPTQNGVLQTLYGTMFLLTQPDGAHALTACLITALAANTIVQWQVAG